MLTTANESAIIPLLHYSDNKNLGAIVCSNNQLEILLLPINSQALWWIVCNGNPFEKDPQRLKFLAESLPKKTSGMNILNLSEGIDTSIIKDICTSKKWRIYTS